MLFWLWREKTKRKCIYLYLGTCYGAKWCEFLPETFVVDSVVQVLDIEIDALVTVHPLNFELLELPFELLLPLRLLLGPAHVKGLLTHIYLII